MVMQILWLYVDDLAGKGLDFGVLGELMFLFTLSFVPTALPLAILLASLMTFGNMGEHLELTAMKSSGIPLQRIMVPLIALVSVLAVGSFLFSNNVMPYANKKVYTLLYDIRNKRPELNIQAGPFYSGIDGFSIKIAEKDPESNLLKKIWLYDHRDRKGNIIVVIADSGYMKVTPDKSGLVMTLFNGHSYTETPEKNKSGAARTYPFRKDAFAEQTIVIDLANFDLVRSGDDVFGSASRMLNLSMLTKQIDSLNVNYLATQSTYYEEFNRSGIYVGRNDNEIDRSGSDLTKTLPFDVKTTFDTLQVFLKQISIQGSIESVKNAARQIDHTTEILHNEIKFIKKYEADWHRKFSNAFGCFVFFFIGAPLGAIIRKGGLGTPAVISILFFVVYYVISLSGEKLVKENHISTIGGMWLSSFILLPIGIMLTYMATTDSVVMSVETYTSFFKQIGRKLTFKKAEKSA